ncbi:MAG: 16S rRNA (cytosine(1402)-N(4))-methyltransferase RsmH [Candidatus Pacebacteria bacterium]|nr:16S rRNA (cytosine(1402)-N(4))-methyltransferase RsmH [Candidatus Paceibacterota bacterium]
MKTNHITVLLNEAVEGLNIKPGNWYVDATFGGGGHTDLILKNGGKVIAFDFDQNAIEMGRERFKREIDSEKLILVEENFTKLKEELNKIKSLHNIKKIDGVLFDFGTSTDQLMNEKRGFSFSGEGELDMRMDQNLGVKAKDLLALLSEKQLTETFFQLGGETEAKKIAKAIVANRKQGLMINTNQDLATLIEKVKRSRNRTHPATKVFQALRIVVNDELNNILDSLPQALEIVESGSRIVAISFHEGEDRIVKSTFKNWQETNQGTLVTNKPITPSDEAIKENPRCRSAKMRIFTRKGINEK